MAIPPAAAKLGFKSVKRASIYLQVAEQIRTKILDRELSEGVRLPPERELSEQFGVSRATVREALRHLQAQGLLASSGRTSSMQTASPDAAVARFRESLIHVVKLRGVSLADLVELRAAIEVSALTRAAQHPVAEHLEKARAALRSMQESRISASDYYEADVAFHVALVAASGNQAFLLTMQAIRDSIRIRLDEAMGKRAFASLRPKVTSEHEALLRAVEQGNTKAIPALVRSHLEFYET